MLKLFDTSIIGHCVMYNNKKKPLDEYHEYTNIFQAVVTWEYPKT